MIIINVSNLKVGMIIKNYPKFCELVGEEKKAGNCKKVQTDRWKRYIEWKRDGHKYIIKSIRETAKPKKLQKNDIYSQDVLTVLTDYIIKKENDIQMSTINSFKKNDYLFKSDIMILCGFVNSNYKRMLDCIKDFSYIHHCSSNLSLYQFNKLYEHIKSYSLKNLELCLNRLEKRNYIHIEKIIIIKFSNGKIQQAREDEIKWYQKTEATIKKDLGIKYMSLYTNLKFNRALSLKLKEKEIDAVYKYFKISRGIENFVFQIDESEIEEAKHRINEHCLKKMYDYINQEIEKQKTEDKASITLDEDLTEFYELMGKSYDEAKEEILKSKYENLAELKKLITDFVIKIDYP